MSKLKVHDLLWNYTTFDSPFAVMEGCKLPNTPSSTWPWSRWNWALKGVWRIPCFVYNKNGVAWEMVENSLAFLVDCFIFHILHWVMWRKCLMSFVHKPQERAFEADFRCHRLIRYRLCQTMLESDLTTSTHVFTIGEKCCYAMYCVCMSNRV